MMGCSRLLVDYSGVVIDCICAVLCCVAACCNTFSVFILLYENIWDPMVFFQ